MDAFPALVFGPNFPPGGVAGHLQLLANGLEVSTADDRRVVAISALHWRDIGFEHSGIEIAWEQDGQQWAAHLLDPKQVRQFRNLPALANVHGLRQLTSTQSKHRTGRIFGWALINALLLLPLWILLVFLTKAEWFTNWVADHISIEREMRYGRDAFEQLRPSLSLQDEGPAYQAVVQLGQRLTQGSRYHYEFHVVNDDNANAMALPGGIILVYDGLINATTRPEQLAGVIAHEIQHVEHRDTLRNSVYNLGITGVWSLVFGDFGVSLSRQMTSGLFSAQYSRLAESQADDDGFTLLEKQGIDPSAIPEFFGILQGTQPSESNKSSSDQTRSKNIDRWSEVFASHPHIRSRRAALAVRVNKLDGRRFAP